MLTRFHIAQDKDYKIALTELKNGCKKNHWMWFIFPQLKGLGHSDCSIYYGVDGLIEAKEYLADDILGKRLFESSQALLQLPSTDANEIFGITDALKLKSSMTLFFIASEGNSIFRAVLNKFFEGNLDCKTLEYLHISATQLL